MRVLGIETSCDETAIAVVDDGRTVLANIVASQIAEHARYGGVVPEVACRAHSEQIFPVLLQALAVAGATLDQIEGIAVTVKPGLVGALLVGMQAAKGLAYMRRLPLVGVDHIEGHLYANQLGRGELPLPTLHLVVSGGHTHLFLESERGRYKRLGRTIDDAAGEAFDKISILMGLGYPGGPAIERAAQGGNSSAVAFPRALPRRDSHDFSFSGFKTAVRTHIANHPLLSDIATRDVAASVQEAIVDVLALKTFRLAQARRVAAVALTGGVAANTALRERFAADAARMGFEFFVPAREYCTDNAAMIAGLGHQRLAAGDHDSLDLDASPKRA